jgi:hypothetical protein
MNNSNPKKKATLAATKRALHDMMTQDGVAFPETPEDIDRIEAEIDDSSLPTPDVNSFIQFLHGEKPEPAVEASIISPFESATHAQDLALAARNGGDIDAEIRKRMDEHRASAEEKAKKKQ